MPGSSGEYALGPGGTRTDVFIDPEQPTEVAQTVTFNEDATVEVTREDCRLDTRFLYGGEDGLENSAKDFLKRPIAIAQFVWSNGQAQNTSLLSKNFPAALLGDTMVKEKIAGFRYFRGDLVVRLQVNGQPFNAGRLKMAFEPFRNSQSITPSNLTFMNGFSGYRNVDLDIGCVTAAELRVPYMSPLAFTDLVTGFGEMGNIEVRVYSPLTGGDDVECTLWAFFDNVFLEMPTGEPLFSYPTRKLYAQSGNGGLIDTAMKGMKDKMNSGDKIFKKNDKSKTPSPSKDKVESKNKERKVGDWENLFGAQQRVLDKFGDIPVLGEFSKVVSWFANIGEGFAGMFGYSKPTNPNFETPVSIRYLRNYTNFNGNTLSKPLALDARNEIIRPDNFFGTDEDEMSLAKICSIPIYMTSFNMSASNAPPSVIWKWPVNPNSCFSVESDTLVTRFNTYLSFLSNLFDMWRGTINYKFIFVKSPFQSGRLRFFFAPGATMDTDVTTINVEKCYSQIVDIRSTNEIVFSIPFVSNRLWNDLSGGDIDVTKMTNSEPTGILYCEVLNTLKTSGQAADSIQILVETFGGKDLQFAFPRRDPRAALKDAHAPTSRVLEAQINFFPSQDIKGVDANVSSVGEVVTSLRQLLKRYVRMTNVNTPLVPDDQSIIIYPYLTSLYDNGLNDFFSWTESIFAMYSGSMRLMLEMISSGSDQSTGRLVELKRWTASAQPGAYFAFSAQPLDETNGTANAKFFPILEEVIELDVPWYQPVPAMPTQVGRPQPASFDEPIASRVPVNIPSSVRVFSGSYKASRSIGEDFTFGYLIGPPVTTFQNSA